MLSLLPVKMTNAAGGRSCQPSLISVHSVSNLAKIKLGCYGFACSLQAGVHTQLKIVYEYNEASEYQTRLGIGKYPILKDADWDWGQKNLFGTSLTTIHLS